MNSDFAIQDYLNRLQGFDSLQTAIENKLQLKQERTSQILGAFEQLGLPAGLEGLQSLRDSNLLERGKNFLSETLDGDGSGSGLINNLKEGANKLLSNFSDLGDMSVGGDFLKNISQLAGRPLAQGQQILQDIAKNTVSIPEGEGGNFLSKVGGMLKSQALDRLPLKDAVQKAQSLKARVEQLRDGELSTPEQRQGSLTALSKDDLMARLPAGRNFQTEIEGLSGDARNQYIRVMQGDPTEMGDLLPEHLFDHAQFMSSQLKSAGMLNPEELVPEAKEALSQAFDSLPRIIPRGGIARFTASGENLTQPASTSDRLAGLLKSSLEKVKDGLTRPAPAQPAPEARPAPAQPAPEELRPPPAQPAPEITPAEPEITPADQTRPLEGLQQGTQPSEITPAQEGKAPEDTGLNQTASEDIAKEAGEGVGENVAKDAGEAIGEGVGESVIEDALGPIGAIVGLGTLIASLVEGFKHQSMPNLPQPVLQAGTD
jgi:hypothetical protein